MNIPDILKEFANSKVSLFDASEKLLKHLGITCATTTACPISFLELYNKTATEANAIIPKPIKDIFSRVDNTYFIGSVTDDTLKSNKTADFDAAVEAAKDEKYKGMFIFAVEMKPGTALKRSEAAVLVRGFNRVARLQPATVLILEKVPDEARQQIPTLSIATCERTPYNQPWRRDDVKLGKVSILKGINCLNPHRGHIGILEQLNVNRDDNYKTFDALYTHWKGVFSTSELTKQFYREIQNWYFWALKKEQHVAFPNALDDDSDNEKYNAENLIRLITRLIFTWFMKEKGLVNPALFDTEFLSQALRYFNTEGCISDSTANNADLSCSYYRAILQNLFFATFNQEIGLRGFVNSKVRDAQHYNIKNYYRNEKLFKETDCAKIIEYFNGSPFVNGGLFECLDNVEQNGRIYSWDGFSNHVRSKDGTLKSALIPDRLFFGKETTADLSKFFDDEEVKKSYQHVKVRGIINILKDYVFTIEENTPFDVDVALDPELLGKVFENLLGAYNPETRQMARNATGSFYTRREIVNYMVKVTLKSYLKRACPKVADTEIDALVEGMAELADLPSVKENAKEILTALFKAKILDPACGSGAFPMGIMSAMVEILRTVDPDNRHWYEIVLKESLDEATAVADVSDKQEQEELKAQIEFDFNERVEHPDYARKLYIIEHCIFGSDIQPIAVQISRLRFFITLLCEQTKNDNPTKNYGITPLPNLESNFVAANSLLSIDLNGMRELLGQKKIVSLVKQLRGIRHQLFQPKTSDKKKRLQAKDAELRKDIANAAEQLYDENIEWKCEMLSKEITRCDDELAKLGEEDFKDVIEEVEEVDLFGEKTVTTKTIIGQGNKLLKQKKNAENTLALLKNASSKERLLSDIKRLVAWNPFAFNVAESFLDPEWMFGVKNGFDIVISNPPYISAPLQIAVPELKRQRDAIKKSKRFKSLYKKWDLFIPFIEYGIQSCRQNGMCAMIVPFPLTNQPYGKMLRKMIVEQYCLVELADLNGIKFFDANVFNCIPFVQVAEPTRKTWISKSDDNFTIHREFEQSSTDLVQDSKSIVWNTTNEKREVSRHADMYVLGDYCYISVGMVLNADEKTAKGEFKKDDLISEKKDRIHCRKYIEAKDFTRYSVNRVRYLEYGTKRCPGEIRRPTFPELYEVSKLLVNRLGDLAVIGDFDKKYLHSDACFSVVPWYSLHGVENKSIASSIKKFSRLSRSQMEDLSHKVDLRYLLGVMNSCYVSELLTTLRGGDYHIYPEYVRNIPIPTATTKQQKSIIDKVDKILAAKKADPNADTSALEAEIDELVFDLYGLTPEERELVKGGEH